MLAPALVDHLDQVLPAALIENERTRDRLLYLVALLTNPDQCRDEEDYWRPLYSQILDRIIGKQGGKSYYASLLVALENAGVIEVDRCADLDTHQCNKYRCAWSWQGARRKVYNLLTIKRKKVEEATRTDIDASDPAVVYLDECWRRTALDVRKAIRTILSFAGADLSLVEGDGELTSRDYAALSEACGACPRAQAALQHVWTVWVDEVSTRRRDRFGRYHSPVTSLWSALRDCLSIDGDDDLVSLDIRGSQLVFAAWWMMTSGPMWQAKGATPDDWHAWIELVQDPGRDPYRETYQMCHGRYPTDVEREAWKAQMFGGWWYATAWWQGQSPIGKVLGTVYPTVHTWIHSKKASIELGHAAYPCQLQRIEARCMIDDLVVRLRDAGVVAQVVHDSLIVRRRDLETARTLMHAALDRALSAEGQTIRYHLKQMDLHMSASLALSAARLEEAQERDARVARYNITPEVLSAALGCEVTSLGPHHLVVSKGSKRRAQWWLEKGKAKVGARTLTCPDLATFVAAIKGEGEK